MNEIYVTRPSLPPFEEYSNRIKELWNTRYLTNMGRYHGEFESELKNRLDVPYISLMVNGHMALEMTIQAFDFPEDAEVITTPFTFVSTIHAIVRNRLTPVFCDVKESDGTIDASKIENLITDKTVAILPVHVYGHICDVKEISNIAEKHGLKVIYDAAHTFGETIEGESVAKYGDASTYSFHSTKVFHSIEGGAVATADKEVYDRLLDLRNFGFRGEDTVNYVGANAKMNEFSAAMGLCNLEHLEENIRARRHVAEIYDNAFSNLSKITLFHRDDKTKRNYVYYPILAGTEGGNTRDVIYESLRKKGIYSRRYFYPVCSDMKCYIEKYGKSDVTIARSLSNRVLCLPIYEGLSDADVTKICDAIWESFES